MNERYLFRGKRVDNGEWVIGDLLQWGDGDMQIVVNDDDGEKSKYTVIPETVGQCTGLKDKNGKLVFEGDVVNYEETLEERAETLHGTYRVVYNYCNYSPFDCITPTYCEVIGNIHDNPELLEVKE